jgi:capsular polysaccharide biosynthesis protein
MPSQTIIISNGAVYNDYSDIPDMIQQLKAKNPGFSEHRCTLHAMLAFTKKPKMIKLGNAGDANIYHILFYMIPRFHYIDENPQLYFYYPLSNPFIEDILSNFPPKYLRISDFDPTCEYIELPGLLWDRSEAKNEEWVYQYVRTFFKKIWENTACENKSIFISRNHPSTINRRLVNEDEILPILQRKGIQKVYMEDLSFCDKIRLFKSSKLILGIHGAGMSYSVFCDPSVKIIEIRNAAPSYKHYHEICERLAFSYTQFTDVIEDETKKHLKINVPVFEAFLERYFA